MDTFVTYRYSKFIYDLPACPIKNVGLLLGTSKHLGKGYENLYFRYRIDAVKTLHSEHKVSHWIVSGDNSISQYNEPKSMQEDLLNLGIEPKKFSPTTLDSELSTLFTLRKKCLVKLNIR